MKDNCKSFIKIFQIFCNQFLFFVKTEAKRKRERAKMLILPFNMKRIYTPISQSSIQKTKEVPRKVFSQTSSEKSRAQLFFKTS
ncbi:MAG: hypothetical protein IKU52_04620, partial [Clostridia bacterium]|nr:hypothetical protein [Clostridia bacterium]